MSKFSVQRGGECVAVVNENWGGVQIQVNVGGGKIETTTRKESLHRAFLGTGIASKGDVQCIKGSGNQPTRVLSAKGTRSNTPRRQERI